MQEIQQKNFLLNHFTSILNLTSLHLGDELQHSTAQSISCSVSTNLGSAAPKNSLTNLLQSQPCSPNIVGVGCIPRTPLQLILMCSITHSTPTVCALRSPSHHFNRPHLTPLNAMSLHSNAHSGLGFFFKQWQHLKSYTT